MFMRSASEMTTTLKTWNVFTNTIIFPGSTVASTYTTNDYHDTSTVGDVTQRLLFIPFHDDSLPFSAPKYIVCMLTSPPGNASMFFIHFHGNLTDLGQFAPCSRYECDQFTSHYLAMEYPQYGVCRDGFPSERVLTAMAIAVHRFVVQELKVYHQYNVFIFVP